MAIFTNFSIVIQGPILVERNFCLNFLEHLKNWKTTYPETEIILSVSQLIYPNEESFDKASHSNLDKFIEDASLICSKIIFAEEKLELPSLIFHSKPNNCNRMISAAQSGLSLVSRDFVLRVRNDIFIKNFEKIFEHLSERQFRNKILISPFYTLNPFLREKLSFHLSDWFNFGTTDSIQSLWNIPYYSYDDATYFENHEHEDFASEHERNFRGRYTPEQWITINYAKKRGYKIPNYLYERGFEISTLNLIRENFNIVNLEAMGFFFPKYMDNMKINKANQLHCVSPLDWEFLHENGVDLFLEHIKDRIFAANELSQIYGMPIRSLRLRLLIAKILFRFK